jgi:DNA-directed RNA polymerase specialized sigma24 family protein
MHFQPGRLPEINHRRFVELREQGDGLALAWATVHSPRFDALRQRAGDFLLRGRNRTQREEILERATDAIVTRLARTCGAGYRGNDDNDFAGFLYGLCLNNVCWAIPRYVQHLKRHRPLGPDDDVPAKQTPHKNLAALSELVRATIAGWDDQRLAAVMRHDLLGTPDEFIAQELGCCLKTVYVYRQRGLARLRKAVEESGLF